MYRLYDFKCTKCDFVFEKIVQKGLAPDCPKCGGKTDQLPPIVKINMGVGPYGYYDETLDKYISTNKQKKEEMRKQGVTQKGDTPKPTGQQWI